MVFLRLMPCLLGSLFKNRSHKSFQQTHQSLSGGFSNGMSSKKSIMQTTYSLSRDDSWRVGFWNLRKQIKYSSERDCFFLVAQRSAQCLSSQFLYRKPLKIRSTSFSSVTQRYQFPFALILTCEYTLNGLRLRDIPAIASPMLTQ